MRLIVDSTPLAAREGDNVLTALVRSGRVPPGCLCYGGDCPHCLASIDGVPYVRMCQTLARDGMRVEPFDVQHPPEIPSTEERDISHRFARTDVVVVGAGRSGRAEASRLRGEGLDVVVVDSNSGDEALAVYPGPEVIARVDGAIVRIQATEVVIATGSVEIQPVCEGSRLAGILTSRAASHLSEAGVGLGRVVRIEDGAVPLRFDGTDRVEAVVTRDRDGVESRRECDTVVVDLGAYPRDILARMGGEGVRTVGGAGNEPQIPACPESGTVCPCSDVTVADLDFVWDRGFRELELLKRATLAGTGTCQGGVCSPYLRSFAADRGGELQPTFTARPLGRQMTMAEAAAAYRFPPIHRTGLDAVHRDAGAQMDRMGGWWRPWKFPHPEAEYRAVREAVSLGDVSTLGKVLVRGRDAVDFLERVYPCHVSDLAAGRSRYALILAESGGLLDDGLISRVDDTTFALTFTSGGASFAEAWLRDWAHGFGADVRIMDVTHSLGAINVTGPDATELLSRAGLDEPVRFMRHTETVVAGVPCRVFRLSFTGEVSYELHHPASRSVELWEELMRLGADLGVLPHGLFTLQTLRLEKGHVIVGMDTEPDSTPRRLGMEWAVKMDKPDFVGRAALARTDRQPLDRRLIGLTMDSPAPVDGSPVYGEDGTIAGYVTSAAWSPVLSSVVMLAWVDLVDGQVPETVVVDDRPAHHTEPPFYDPGGDRARA